MHQIVHFLTTYFIQRDKKAIIRQTRRGKYKWYLFSNDTLRAISHPVRGFDTCQEAEESIKSLYRFDAPLIVYED